LAAGMDEYVSKPISAAVVFAMVEQPGARSAVVPAEEETSFSDASALIDDIRKRFTDDEVALDAITTFLVYCPSQLSAVTAAVDSGDATRIRSTAHTLKGAAANVSGSTIVRCAADLERIAQADAFDGAQAAVVLANLEAETTRFMDDLRASVPELEKLCS
jgi:two-component system sensor histidine kinase/response regulator